MRLTAGACALDCGPLLSHRLASHLAAPHGFITRMQGLFHGRALLWLPPAANHHPFAGTLSACACLLPAQPTATSRCGAWRMRSAC